MSHRKLFMASAIIAAVAGTACSDTTAPKQLGPGDVSFARSGTFHVEKNCNDYHGMEGELCTITSSTLKEIEPGSSVTYATAAGATSLESDLVLDLPGPGNNTATGHVVLDFVTLTGVVTFSGGTGKFKWFQARVDVTHLRGNDWAWDGTYSFSPRD
jgi:hypothetical protein